MPRRADQPGEHRRLTDRQVSRLFTEVKLRSLPDAEDTARASLSEIDLVQIRLEDLYLAVVKLHQQGHHRFGYFAFHGTRTGQKEILDELLGERATALHDPSLAKVGVERAAHAAQVNAVVLEAAFVSSGEHRLNEKLRHLVDLHDPPLFGGLTIDTGRGLGLELECVEGLAGIESGDGGRALAGEVDARGEPGKGSTWIVEIA